MKSEMQAQQSIVDQAVAAGDFTGDGAEGVSHRPVLMGVALGLLVVVMLML